METASRVRIALAAALLEPDLFAGLARCLRPRAGPDAGGNVPLISPIPSTVAPNRYDLHER